MFLLWAISLFLWSAGPSDCAPLPWELVDMSYTFDNTTLHWPKLKDFELKINQKGKTDEGYWLQLDEFSSAVHVGTHMDAPCHFAEGKLCVDEIPLERLAGPAAVVDITERAEADPDAMVEIDDLREWEGLSGRSLNGTIVVMRTGWGRRYKKGREAYTGNAADDADNLHFPGLSPKAAQWLVDNRDIHGVASETLSIDHGPSKDFRSHRILAGANVYGLENVANVEEIPIVGAFLHVHPMKIGKGSGAPTRIIAKYPKVTFKPKDGKSVTERSLREVIIFQ